MTTTKIDMQVGIYSSELTIRDYGTKICITTPYVKWSNNSGTLDFSKETVTNPRKMALIRQFANTGELCIFDGDDVITWDEI